jgi:hypothetical protein
VIDNAEEIIEHEGAGGTFKSLTAHLLNYCPALSIVVTSRRSMGILKDTFQGKIQVLTQLSLAFSVELFFDRTQGNTITSQEVFQVLKMDQNYPT